MQKFTLTLSFLLFFGGSMLAQTSRIEIPLESQSFPLSLINLEKDGFLLYSLSAQTSSKGQLQMIFYHYDSLLEEKKAFPIQFHKKLKLSGTHSAHGNAYLLFHSPNQEFFQVAQIDVRQQKLRLSQFRFYKNFYPYYFQANGAKAWLGGRYKGTPLVSELNLGTQKSRLLPTGSDLPILGIQGLFFDKEREEINYLLQTTIKNRRSYCFRQVNKFAKLETDLYVDFEENYQLENGKIFPLHHHPEVEFAISGIYRKPNSSKIRGVFLILIQGEAVKDKIFLDFKDLSDLNKAQIIRGNQLMDKTFSRKINFVSVEHVDYQEGQFLLSFEAYAKTFRTRNSAEKDLLVQSREANMRRPPPSLQGSTQTRTNRRPNLAEELELRYRNLNLIQAVPSGISYNHSGVLLFDEYLKPRSSQTFLLEGGTRAHFLSSNNAFVHPEAFGLYYIRDNQLRGFHFEDKMNEGKVFKQDILDHAESQIRNEGRIEAWHGDSFLIWGRQKFTKSKKAKDIFYVQKIPFTELIDGL